MQEFDFLASLEFFGVKLGLHQTEELFRRLGSPEKEFSSFTSPAATEKVPPARSWKMPSVPPGSKPDFIPHHTLFR